MANVVNPGHLGTGPFGRWDQRDADGEGSTMMFDADVWNHSARTSTSNKCAMCAIPKNPQLLDNADKNHAIPTIFP